MNKLWIALVTLGLIAFGLTLLNQQAPDEEHPLVVVLLGPPGAGKSVLASGLQQKRSLPHISTGELLRENRKSHTPLGRAAQEYMDKGLLVPDDLVLNMLKERLQADDCAQGYLLDGFPRTLAQAEALDAMLAEDTRLLVVELQVGDDTVMRRILGRAEQQPEGSTRTDDQPEVIKTRLETYHRQNAPLVAYYRQKGVLKTINNERPLETVMAEFFSLVDQADRG